MPDGENKRAPAMSQKMTAHWPLAHGACSLRGNCARHWHVLQSHHRQGFCSLQGVAALDGQIRGPTSGASAPAVTRRLHEARLPAGPLKYLRDAHLQWADLRDRRHVQVGLELLRGGAHAVAVAVGGQDVEHSLLANEVTLVDDELADALGPDLHKVEAPAL